jgi:hypothetical protein
MKTTGFEAVLKFSVRIIIRLWDKAPLILLVFLYSFFVLAQKEWGNIFSPSPEQYYHNNNLQVNKLGKGSICVHMNQPLIYSNYNSSFSIQH